MTVPLISCVFSIANSSRRDVKFLAHPALVIPSEVEEPRTLLLFSSEFSRQARDDKIQESICLLLLQLLQLAFQLQHRRLFLQQLELPQPFPRPELLP